MFKQVSSMRTIGFQFLMKSKNIGLNDWTGGQQQYPMCKGHFMATFVSVNLLDQNKRSCDLDRWSQFVVVSHDHEAWKEVKDKNFLGLSVVVNGGTWLLINVVTPKCIEAWPCSYCCMLPAKGHLLHLQWVSAAAAGFYLCSSPTSPIAAVAYPSPPWSH